VCGFQTKKKKQVSELACLRAGFQRASISLMKGHYGAEVQAVGMRVLVEGLSKAKNYHS